MLIIIVFFSVKECSASFPHSRSNPHSFDPPKGAVIIIKLTQLIPTIPLSNSLATLKALLISCVNTPAISPKLVLFDFSRISSSVLNEFKTATRPKIYSVMISASEATLVKTVGSIKNPLSQIREPPVRSVPWPFLPRSMKPDTRSN
jgi:hypothetical protein